MSLSQLASNCQACPYKDTCDHKRMEAVGFLQPLQNEQLMSTQESLIVPHDYRQVKIAPGTEVTIDLEDFREEIKKQSLNTQDCTADFSIIAVERNSGRTGGINVTGKELILKLIDENALDKEISIEIYKHDIPINSYKYEYFSVVDINVSGNQLIFHVKVENNVNL